MRQSLRRPAESLAGGLAAIADAFAPVGIVRQDQTARIPRLIGDLAHTSDHLSRWLAAVGDHAIGGFAPAMIAAMKAAGDCAQAVLAATRTALADPLALLKAWTAEPNAVLRQASRCDWLLDGWEWVCLLWRLAQDTPARLAALLEMARLVPVLPREAADWVDHAIPPAAMDQPFRITSQNDTWRRGVAALGLVHRNEALRAMTR